MMIRPQAGPTPSRRDVQQRHSQFDDVDDDDASMGDLENYEEAEYVPGSSSDAAAASLPPTNDPFGFQRQQPQSQPWGVPPKQGMKRVASRELQQPPTQEVAPCAADFKIISVIGKGSFGKVFLVRQVRTNKTFAMKVLKKENIVKRELSRAYADGTFGIGICAPPLRRGFANGVPDERQVVLRPRLLCGRGIVLPPAATG